MSNIDDRIKKGIEEETPQNVAAGLYSRNRSEEPKAPVAPPMEKRMLGKYLVIEANPATAQNLLDTHLKKYNESTKKREWIEDGEYSYALQFDPYEPNVFASELNVTIDSTKPTEISAKQFLTNVRGNQFVTVRLDTKGTLTAKLEAAKEKDIEPKTTEVKNQAKKTVKLFGGKDG